MIQHILEFRLIHCSICLKHVIITWWACIEVEPPDALFDDSLLFDMRGGKEAFCACWCHRWEFCGLNCVFCRNTLSWSRWICCSVPTICLSPSISVMCDTLLLDKPLFPLWPWACTAAWGTFNKTEDVGVASVSKNDIFLNNYQWPIIATHKKRPIDDFVRYSW